MIYFAQIPNAWGKSETSADDALRNAAAARGASLTQIKRKEPHYVLAFPDGANPRLASELYGGWMADESPIGLVFYGNLAPDTDLDALLGSRPKPLAEAHTPGALTIQFADEAADHFRDYLQTLAIARWTVRIGTGESALVARLMELADQPEDDETGIYYLVQPLDDEGKPNGWPRTVVVEAIFIY